MRAQETPEEAPATRGAHPVRREGRASRSDQPPGVADGYRNRASAVNRRRPGCGLGTPPGSPRIRRRVPQRKNNQSSPRTWLGQRACSRTTGVSPAAATPEGMSRRTLWGGGIRQLETRVDVAEAWKRARACLACCESPRTRGRGFQARRECLAAWGSFLPETRWTWKDQ